MAKDEASVVLYAVDLDELREWVGCKDQERFEEALEAIGEDEDSGWEGELAPVLERLLRRVVFEGKLYEDLSGDDRYFLTQLLIDLFDESVDQDALTESLSLDRLLEQLREMPKDSEAATLASFLLRGRELGGNTLLWSEGRFEDHQPLLGYITRDEAPKLAAALAAIQQRRAQGGARPPAKGARAVGNMLKQIQTAAEECARAELDLVSLAWMAGP